MTENEYKKVPLADIEENDTTQDVPKYGYGIRHIQVLFLFISLTIAYSARSHLGVTIVAMTIIPNIIEVTDKPDLNVTVNPLSLENNATINDLNNVTIDIDATGIYQKYIWTKPTQEMILISFFLGYSIAQFPMSMVAQKWGGKITLQIGLLTNAILSVATPWLVLWGDWKATCICRLIQGLTQGGMFPAIQQLLALWIPVSERAKLNCYVYTGSTVGTVLGFQLAGLLSDTRWLWPAAFWGSGVLCLVTFIFITIFISDSPNKHKYITVAEKNYIIQSVGVGVAKKSSVPWKAMWTSKHVWGTFITHIGSGIVFTFILMQVPTYIHYTLGVDVKNSGILSSLPYIASIFTSVSYGMISDFYTNRNMLTVKNARRLFNCISQIGIAACLIAFSFTKNLTLAVGLLVLAMSCHSGIHAGWMLNYIDLAPNYAGIMVAIGNTFMNAGTLGLPVIISYIVTDVTNQYQWRIIFSLTAAVAFVANAVFVILLSDKKEPWNDPEHEKIGFENVVLETKSKKEIE